MDKIAQREESSLGAKIRSLGSPDIQGESRERREVQKIHNEQQGREEEIQSRPEEDSSVQCKQDVNPWKLLVDLESGDVW